MASILTSRWFLSLRRKVNKGIVASAHSPTPEGHTSKPIFTVDTGPDIRFEMRRTGTSFDLSKTSLELGRTRLQSTTVDIENDSDRFQECVARNEEERDSCSMGTARRSQAVKAHPINAA